MEDIIAMLDKMDLSEVMPDIDGLLGQIAFWMRLLLLVGPVISLALGLGYLLLPAKEATYRRGFRTYWGMGSVRAWRFTQRLAGIAMGSLGLILGIVMLVVTGDFQNMSEINVVITTINCLLWEIGLILFCRFGIGLTAFILFDSDGYRRTYSRSKPRY